MHQSCWELQLFLSRGVRRVSDDNWSSLPGKGQTIEDLHYCTGSWLYFVLKRRKFVKLKEKYFQQNGGSILERRLNNSQRGSHETVKIFTAEGLEKATKKYDESRIIGRGGFGVVYKGFLSDNRIVAIKKSKTVDQRQAEQFINEVVVLSQINHRHIVNSWGVFRDTSSFMVYEFVPKGTLFQYIHQDSSISTLPWEIRLRIATETAEALWYLHSVASPPIIHRDVKSSNILLDDNFTAKLKKGEQIKELVEIATSCLEVKGEERPTMKEVAIRLDGLQKRKKHPWVNVEISHADVTENLLDATCVATAEIAGYDSSMNSHGPMHKDLNIDINILDLRVFGSKI
ncbi:Wall-associated receptor kinase 3 [Morella rubra]|uniref:Wall-associated receptor kinase 3 n=1 Tax=Morella rubra TaxID=262757 RepID=A0A6A1VJ03_9ROSI|nr:Wall-associated receptor kinase 3 [Morella rubra]